MEDTSRATGCGRMRGVTPIQKGELEASIVQKLRVLSEAGVLQWSGRRLEPVDPVVSVSGSLGVADIIVQERR